MQLSALLCVELQGVFVPHLVGVFLEKLPSSIQSKLIVDAKRVSLQFEEARAAIIGSLNSWLGQVVFLLDQVGFAG